MTFEYPGQTTIRKTAAERLAEFLSDSLIYDALCLPVVWGNPCSVSFVGACGGSLIKPVVAEFVAEKDTADLLLYAAG